MFARKFHGWIFATIVAALPLANSSPAVAQPVVPGTGTKVAFDDFEDTAWDYTLNLPKSSQEQDGQTRKPGGISKNRKWYESELRGQMDMIKRVPTPEGGLTGSEGAMLMRSNWVGIPQQPKRKPIQDDLLFNAGKEYSVSQSPSFVVRVWLPPFDKWEQRTGNSFGLRAGCRAPSTKKGKGGIEPYWPGLFLFFDKGDGQKKQDSVVMLIRADQNGHDKYGPRITEPGWWTMGMSFTPDGQVHYYAKAGTEDLTAKDRLMSQYPYGFRCQKLSTFFFNVVAVDDGVTWSTPWIVDDPAIYVGRR